MCPVCKHKIKGPKYYIEKIKNWVCCKCYFKEKWKD